MAQPTITQLVSQANDAATTLQAALRGRSVRRLVSSGAVHQAVEDDRAISPTTIAASLSSTALAEANQRVEAPATPGKTAEHASVNPSGEAPLPMSMPHSMTSPYGGLAQSTPPTPAAPEAMLTPATTLAMASGLNPQAVPMLPSASLPSYSAQSAAAAAGLTIQTPAQTLSSPPYSPSPHSAPPTAGGGMMQPSPPPPPSLMGSGQSPDTHQLSMHQRPHSVDDAMLSPHTPWMQSRTQSRLPGMVHLASPADVGAHHASGLPSSGVATNLQNGVLPSANLSQQTGIPTSMGMGLGQYGVQNAMLQMGNTANLLNNNAMGMGGVQHNQLQNQLNSMQGQMSGLSLSQLGQQTMMSQQANANNMMIGQMGQQNGGMAGGLGQQMPGMGASQMGQLNGQMGMNGMNGMNGLGGMGQRPQMPPLTAEQHRVRVISNLVMERLCVWGEYRTVGDWPQELVAHGSMPAVAEALQASPTHSLTIPQLVTAVKERTGNAHGGKALDMLNLKAYVRCFPALFHLRSGRTAAGRPLDVVELRIEINENGAMHPQVMGSAPSAANTQAQGQRQQAQKIQQGMQQGQGRYANGSLGGQAPPPPLGMPSQLGVPNGIATNPMNGQMGGGGNGQAQTWGTMPSARSSLPQLSGYPQVERVSSAPAAAPSNFEPTKPTSMPAPSPSPTPSNGSSTLQPKELFANSENESNSPRSLWGSPGLGSGLNALSSDRFSLFGSTFSTGGSGATSPSAGVSPRDVAIGSEKSFTHGTSSLGNGDNSSSSFADEIASYDGDEAGTLESTPNPGLNEDEEVEDPSMMLAGIDALFGSSTKDDAPSGELGCGDSAARTEYIKRFQLDRLFAAAVDRAIRHQVTSPVEFIAHELLRTVEQRHQHTTA